MRFSTKSCELYRAAHVTVNVDLPKLAIKPGKCCDLALFVQ